MIGPLDHPSNVLVSEVRGELALEGAVSPDGGAPSGLLSFEQLYDHWFDDVARWVRALGARQADRDDLVQDVFLVAYRRMPDFDGQNVAGWLYQIARRKVRDHRRLLWVKHLFGPSLPLTDGMLRTENGPLDSLETKQKRALLERLLDGLNETQRAAFVLFEIEGSTGEEIANLQGVPINTVWARIHKARKRLHEQAARVEKQAARGRVVG